MRKREQISIGVLAFVFSALTPFTQTAVAQAEKLVILVRHSEQESIPGDDPVLSEAGWDRAAALATMLEDTNINHMITSQLKRSVLSTRYVAEARGLEPEIVSTSGGLLAHIEATVDAINRRPDGDAILVVGHSNTIPRIVNALAGSDFPDLDESIYSTVYTVILPDGGNPRLIVSCYGRSSVAD